MTDRTDTIQTVNAGEGLLEESLTFDVIGCFIQVCKDYGLGHCKVPRILDT